MHTRSRCLLAGAFLAVNLLDGQTSVSPPVKGQTSSSSPASAGTPSTAPTTEDLNALRNRIAQQEEQIRKLQQAVQEQRALLDQAVASASTKPAPATASSSNTSGPVLVEAAQKNITESKPSPLSIPIGSSTFTPFGFVDFTLVGRSTNLGSGIGSNFGGVPYNNSAAAHLSETNFSAQNSRIGFRVDSRILGAKVLGYFEADFLGNQPGNVFVTSNADTFRMRNVFVDVQKAKWEFVGGQDWSMFTPNRRLLSPVPADIFYTLDMDTNYQAGLVWTRQGQFRAIYHPNEDWALGVSLENPQQYIGGSGGLPATAVTLPGGLASVLTPQFNNNASPVGSTTGGGNYATPNVHPDIIVKAAHDAHVGANDKIFHVEAGALIRTFKDSIPEGTPASYISDSKTAVSGEVNANLEIFKNIKLIANTFFGQGGGRYVFAMAPDLIVRADGSISPIHTYSTVDGIEAGIGKNSTLFGYYGGMYASRQVALDANGRTPIGYGFAGSTNGDNRAIQEITLGWVQNFWKSPSWGTLSLINQYSYVLRNPWFAALGSPRSAHTNMYYIDIRYTIP